MTEFEIRTMLAEACVSSGIYTLRDNGWTEAFVAGSRDIAFSEIEMDSLATMELCIAIEINTGAVILPEDLQHLASLGDLIRLIARN
jgi:hypothetical protein